VYDATLRRTAGVDGVIVDDPVDAGR